MARQRRHKTHYRRRGRFRGLYRFLSVLLVAAAVMAACLIFFRVNSVTVKGSARYTRDEVVAASGIETGDSLIALSKSRVAEQIRTQLPYVESVAIQRKLPDGVVLTVKERSAAASVSGGGARWLISSQGKVLEEEKGQSVVTVLGLQAVSPVPGDTVAVSEKDGATLSYVLELLGVLEERGLLAECTRLDCTAGASITLDYDIYELKLPRGGDYSRMIRMLLAALDSEEMPQGVAGIFDFTVKEGEVFFRPQS